MPDSTTISPARYQQVIEAAKILDERGPADWVDKIDLDTLDMATKCVLDQVYKDDRVWRIGDDGELRYQLDPFNSGLVCLGFASFSSGIYSPTSYPSAFGFDDPDLTLKQAWTYYITHRRAVQKEADNG